MASDKANLKTRILSAVKSKLSGRPKALTICWSLFGLFLVGIFTWVIVASDPMGGEPIAVVELGAKENGDVKTDTDNLGMRTSMRPEDTAKITKNTPEKETTPPPQDIDVVESEPDRSKALPPVPARGLTEKTRLGFLPRISKNGRRPSQIYARKLDPEATGNSAPARIAIFVGDMGLSSKGTRSAINRLPEQITLGFAPYGKNLQSWVRQARDQGHEVLLQIPMEPFDFPDNDPGPYTLLTTLSAAENQSRLNWLMTRFVGYAGVTNYMGAKFTASAEPLKSVFAEFSKRGLVYIDNGASRRSQAKAIGKKIGLGVSVADVLIDANPTEVAIDSALSNLEVIALRRGVAIGYASGLPLSINRIIKWSKSLEQRGVILVPVTATVPAGQT